MTTLEMLNEANNNNIVYKISTPKDISYLKFNSKRGFYVEHEFTENKLFTSDGFVNTLNEILNNAEWVVERPRLMTREEVDNLMIKTFGYRVEII